MRKIHLPQSKTERRKLLVILLIMLVLLSFALSQMYLFHQSLADVKLPDFRQRIETSKKLFNLPN